MSDETSQPDTAPGAPASAQASPAAPAPPAPGGRRRVRVGRWTKRVTGVLLAVAAALAVTAFSVDLGPSLRGVVERQATDFFQRPVHIGGLRAYVARGEIEILDARIDGMTAQARPFLTAKRVLVSVPWWTVLRRTLVIDRIHVTGLDLFIDSYPKDVNNIPRLSRPSNGRKLPFTTVISQVVLDASEFTFRDNDSRWLAVCRNLNLVVVRALGAHYGRATFSRGGLTIQDYLPMTTSFDAGFRIGDGKLTFNRADLTTDVGLTRLTGVADLAHWPEQNYHFVSDVDWPEVRRVFFDGSSWELAGQGKFEGDFHKFRGAFTVKGGVSSPLFQVLTTFGTWRFPRIAGQVLWTPTSMALTNLDSDFHAGRAVQSYAVQWPGNGKPGLNRWDVSYEGVDLKDLGDGLAWPVLRLAGRARGHNTLTWTSGQFSATRGGGGQLWSEHPDALRSPEIPEGLQPVTPDANWSTFDPNKRLSPYPANADITYTWGPEYMETAPGSWAATPHTYLSFSGRTAYGDKAQVPFHLTSTDLQETDRLLVEVLAAFRSPARPVLTGGFGTFDGVLTKAFWDPHIEGTFDMQHVRYWDVDWGRARGRTVIDNAYANMTDTTFERHGGTISTVGRYSIGYPRPDKGQELDARITITRWPIAEFRHAFLMDDWPVDGLASAELHLYGGYDRPDGFGSLRFDQGVAWDETFEYATASLRFEYAGVRSDGIEIHKSTGVVRGAAFSDWHSSTYSFNVTGEKIPVESLDTWRYPQAPLTGVLNFTANGTGSSLDPTYEARGTIADLYLGDEGVGQMSGRLRYVKETVVIEQLEAASPRLSVSGAGRVAMNDQMDAELSFRFTNTRVDPYLRVLAPTLAISPYASASLSGSIRITGELMDYRYASADIAIDKAELALFDYPLKNDGPIRVSFTDNTVRLGRLKLAGDGTELDVSGQVGLTEEQVGITARGRANLAVLQAFFPDLRSSGEAELTASIAGDMREPQFSGSAALTKGRIRHFSLPHSVDDINGAVTFDADGVRLDGLTGKLGGGDVRLGGTIGLRGYRPNDLNISAVGRNMTLRYPEGFQSRLNADLFVRGSMDAAELSGTVTVLHATMTRELDSEAGLLGLAASESSGGVSLGGGASAATGIPLTYEVQILAPQTLRLDTSLARIVGSADLTVRGTYDHPSLTGRVDLNRAEVIFQGNRYVVSRGAIEFTNPAVIQPVFDIEAETRIRVPSGNGFQYGQTYRVTVGIAGTTDKLRPTFSSDPQLPQIDILSLLFGETDPTKLNEAELRARDSGQRASVNLLQASAARLLASPLSSSVGRVMERTLGVDTVQITPLLGFSDTAQLSPTARVTLGKRVSDRVFVTYSRALNTGRAEVILLEYDQSDNLSWVLSKNEDQSFALDFRRRHRF